MLRSAQRMAATVLVLVVMAPTMAAPAAKPLTGTLAQIRQLKAQLAAATDAATQTPLRLALAGAYTEHGRPIEAAEQLNQWLKQNPASPQRADVLLKLIAAQRQAGDWDAAASTSRSFLRDFPNNPQRPAVLAGLVQVARFGQQSASGEASALADWVAAAPSDPHTPDRLLRLARLQEQTGDAAGAIASYQKFAQIAGKDPRADAAGWRAVYLMHERLRKTAEALDAGKAHLTKYPSRPTIAADWRWLGDLARSLDKPTDALAAYRKALAADPTWRDVAQSLVQVLHDRGTADDVAGVVKTLEQPFAGDILLVDAKLLLLGRQLAEKKADPRALQAALIEMLGDGRRAVETVALLDEATTRVGPADAISLLRQQMTKHKSGWTRSELALRLAARLRAAGKLEEAQKVLETELAENPVNRRKLTRDYLMPLVEAQQQEIRDRRRRNIDIDAPARRLAELVRPVAWMGELRRGIDDVSGELGKNKHRDASLLLRQINEDLGHDRLAVLVDTVRNNSRQNTARAVEMLPALAKEAAENPQLFDVAGEAVWQIVEKAKDEQRAALLAYLSAWSDARPENLELAREAAGGYRRAAKHAQAIKYYRRVVDRPFTSESAWQIGVAMSGLLDVYAHGTRDLAAVAALAETLEQTNGRMPPSLRQDLYRQLAEIYAAQKDGSDRQIAFYRKAIELGMTDGGFAAARRLLVILPADQAVATGRKLLADPAAERWHADIGLIVAGRMAFELKDLAGAADLARTSMLRRDTAIGWRGESDGQNTLRDLVALALDVATPSHVSDPQRKALVNAIEALSPQQMQGLLDAAMAGLSGQALHEVAREQIRRLGASGDFGGQLVVFSQILARTRPADLWHWDRNMEIIRQELSRPNAGTASTMLRLLLKQSAQYAEEPRRQARTLLLATYQKFGEDLLAVDERGPLAPLLRGAGYLRLGEEKLAWETYQTNAALFAQRVDEVPAEYVLFVAAELATGNDVDRDVAEQILRTWLARIDRQADVDPAVKSAASLKLADVFYYGRRFDVARAEYQSVVDRFAETPQATEAQFRIGESFMYQKNFAEAAKVFDRLRKSRDADTAIRGQFMTGVLQYTAGNKDEARETFKGLLDLSPAEELASKALYQLALIYGDDHRFREMLDMLEAIGRIGREGKRWHTPGDVLTVMIHDPDMAVVQESVSVPVVVSTTSGDREQVTLVAGSAGRGIYLAELPTALGSPRPGDRLLQLLGSDVISYDYPEEFKARFKYVPPPQGNIRVASDATFRAQSTQIVEETARSVADSVAAQTRIERAADQPREFRSGSEVKPGNPVYVRVIDADRSLSTSVDRVEVTLRASSGDQVRAWISETGPDTGIFEGTIPTAERPPEAIASDSALDRPAALAADNDPATAWESQHDGQPAKWLAADLKDVRPIGRVSFTFPDKSVAPKNWTLETSLNGALWEPVYSTTAGRIAHGLSLMYGPLRHTRYAWSTARRPGAKLPEQLSDYIAFLAVKPAETASAALTTLAIPPYEADNVADVHVISGYFLAPSAGRYSFIIKSGRNGGGVLVIDGRLVPGGNADLSAGWHRLAALLTTRTDRNEKPQPIGLAYLGPSTKGESTQALATASGRGDAMPAPALWTVGPAPQVSTTDTTASIDLPDVPARFVRLNIDGYDGDFVSVSEMRIADGQLAWLPTSRPAVSLADDDVLQVSPGDEITVSYADEVNTRTPGQARMISAKLKATYFNATVSAITYDVRTGTKGQVSRAVRPLYRIDPGDRVVVSITDYDEDTTPQVNAVPFVVRTDSGAQLKLEATETGPTTGIFTKEIETGKDGAADRLAVKPGENVYLIYADRLNTMPGGLADRVAQVQVIEPSDATLAVIPTRLQTPSPSLKVGTPTVVYLPPEEGKPARVVLGAPLTVEVIDPDAAKDSHSSVSVQVTTSAGAELTIPLEISDAARASTVKRGGGPAAGAVAEGRFVGQALLVLGRPTADGKVTQTVSVEQARGLVGAWRYGGGGGAGTVTAPALPVSGADLITVGYTDARNTTGKERKLTSEARMVTDALLAALDRDLESPLPKVHLGQKLYVRLEDGDRDSTPEPDHVTVTITNSSGQSRPIKLAETLGHSGVFMGEVLVQYAGEPASRPATQTTQPAAQSVLATFGDTLTLTYTDEANSRGLSPVEQAVTVAVAFGADGRLLAFTKQFGNEDIAVETLFKLAECHFELFKSHNALGAAAEARQSLEAGRSILAEVRERHRGSAYEARVLYLLGSFHQELKEYDEALEAFRTVVRAFPGSALAPDAQYKIGQCFEDKGEMEQACEEYVRLAYTYPGNPLIAKCMVRLSDYFYKTSKFAVAAGICRQFLEQYGEHEWASKIAFRQGQCHFKAGEQAAAASAGTAAVKGAPGAGAAEYLSAAKAFDLLVEQYPESELRADALFWAGRSYHMAGDYASAYRRYRRTTWDFPDSDAARYARGQLTLPEMLGAAKEDAAVK